MGAACTGPLHRRPTFIRVPYGVAQLGGAGRTQWKGAHRDGGDGARLRDKERAWRLRLRLRRWRL